MDYFLQMQVERWENEDRKEGNKKQKENASEDETIKVKQEVTRQQLRTVRAPTAWVQHMSQSIDSLPEQLCTIYFTEGFWQQSAPFNNVTKVQKCPFCCLHLRCVVKRIGEICLWCRKGHRYLTDAAPRLETTPAAGRWPRPLRRSGLCPRRARLLESRVETKHPRFWKNSQTQRWA